ncbi:hypothetical protein FRC11_011633, partial [Ceratobasidium sp. 423]
MFDRLSLVSSSLSRVALRASLLSFRSRIKACPPEISGGLLSGLLQRALERFGDKLPEWITLENPGAKMDLVEL